VAAQIPWDGRLHFQNPQKLVTKPEKSSDEHRTLYDSSHTYDSSQEYEFLLPDKKTRKFFVSGETE
jgi:hypothetical protein